MLLRMGDGRGTLEISLVGTVLAVAMIGAAELGYRAYVLWGRDRPERDVAGISLIISATLTLMGLLIAFTFGIAQTRYELRRTLTVAEASAISTTFLRQQMLPLPQRERLRALMRDYVAARRAEVSNGKDHRAAAAGWRQTTAVQSRIWDDTVEALDAPETVRITQSLLAATNDMFNVAQARHAALEESIPDRAVRVLLAFVIGVSILMGVGLAAHGSRRLVTSSAMFILIAVAMSLIHDLDTPNSGDIRASAGAMDQVAMEVSSQGATSNAAAGHTQAP